MYLGFSCIGEFNFLPPERHNKKTKSLSFMYHILSMRACASSKATSSSFKPPRNNKCSSFSRLSRRCHRTTPRHRIGISSSGGGERRQRRTPNLLLCRAVSSSSEEEDGEEENNDDPDEYSLSDDMKSSEEEDINEVLKGVAEKEIMLKKLTDTMVKQFLKTGDRGDEDDEDQEEREEKRGKETNEDENDGEFEVGVGEEGEMMRAKNFEMGDGTDESSSSASSSGSTIVFDSIDEEKRDELLKDIHSLPKRTSMRGSVKLFLDSADESEWRKWLPTGLFFGVTTNVQLLEKSETLATANDEDFSFQTLLDLVDAALEYESVNEVHVPSWGLDSDEIWKNGIVLAKNDPQRIVVAVPCTFEGVKAANALVADGARVQISGVFAPHQALMAAAIGASYVAPTFGKMYDAGRDGFKATEEMMKTITKCGSESKILVKNVRSAVDLANLGSIGCDTFAISAEVCEDMFSDSLTAQYNKELNLTVARIGEKQRDLKLEAQKQKLLEMEKQSMPVQDDPESENDSVGATKTTTKVVAAGTTTTSGGENNNNNNNNIVSLEEMPKEVFVESDAADKSGGDNDGSSKGSVDSNDSNVIDSDDFTRKEFDP